MRGRPALGVWLLLTGLLSLPLPSASAANSEPSAIVRHIQQGRYLTARDQLHRLLFSEVEPAWKRRALYLLGHVHLKLGANEEAARYFERARTALPVLSDYALYNLGLAEAGAGRYQEARRAFTSLLSGEPESRLHPHALLKRAEAAFAADAWGRPGPTTSASLRAGPPSTSAPRRA